MAEWASVKDLSLVLSTGQHEAEVKEGDTVTVLVSLRPGGKDGKSIEVSEDDLYADVHLVDYVQDDEEIPRKEPGVDPDWSYEPLKHMTSHDGVQTIKYDIHHFSKPTKNPLKLGVKVKPPAGEAVYDSENGKYHTPITIKAL
ncbi:hypothetical protein [Streptomyces sp. NPDC048057]|uniref:hypothetical protein n=1 Tax=Streptomyces sp. NPDC048057 TaxID=3155628 RepID=UPI003403A536